MLEIGYETWADAVVMTTYVNSRIERATPLGKRLTVYDG